MIQLSEKLKNVKKVAISGHTKPDGDCIGSTLAIYNFIKNKYPNIQATVYLDGKPKAFDLLPGFQEIQEEIPTEENDLFICLDCGDAKRLGKFQEVLEKAKHTICIDHHISYENFCDDNYVVSDASSTCELVYHAIGKENLTFDIAMCLYLGIVHDTGVFQYTCTSSETMEIAGELMKLGIPFSKIISETFFEKTIVQQRILGKALMDCKLILQGQVITSTLTQSQLSSMGASQNDVEEIVAKLRNTKGVQVALFIYETAHEGEYKASFRSTDCVDVSKIASVFGGGGHRKASGATIKGNSIEEVEEKVLEKIKEALEEL